MGEEHVEYRSAVIRVKMPFAATWMDLEMIILRDRQIPCDLTYVWDLKRMI